MDRKIGVIGTGNMGRAIIEGIIASTQSDNSNLIITDSNPDNITQLQSLYNKIAVAKNNKDLAEKADVIILAIKPDIYSDVLNEIKNSIDENTIIVIIAAGMKINKVEGVFSFPVKVVRTMPNTPLLVNEGMTAICGGNNVSPEDVRSIENIFNKLGLTEIIEEKYFDVFTALSGSSPAYIFMLIEAMADGGVLNGFPRVSALKIVSQAVKGASEMVLKTGKHPSELKDMVCSPGGTTIEAVASLEEDGFRSALINAVSVCTEKSRSMGNK